MSEYPKYAKTQAELARFLPKIDGKTGETVDGISVSALKATWMRKNGNPGKKTHGFPVVPWRSFVLQHLEESISRAGGNELDDIKKREQVLNIRVQRARAEEGLKQDQLKTQREAGELVERAAIIADDARRHRSVRGALSSWRQHETAKHPDRREIIDELCEHMLRVIHDAMA